MGISVLSFDRLKIHSAMLAQRADDILGELVALVDVAANLADKAFLAFGLGLRLDVLLIVVVGHGLPVADDAGFGHAADEHAVGTQIHILLHL